MKRLLAVAPLLLFTSVDAAVPHDVCVNQGFGVPLRGGPPNWWDAAPAGDPALDDPRWNQATAHSFEFGSATAPLHVRALWTNNGGEALLLSFVSDLSPNQTTAARDLFLGFRRAHPDTKNTPDPSDDEYGYIIQIHLAAGGSGAAQPLAFCGKYSACPANTNWWRTFLDANSTGQCPDTGHNGHLFSQFNGGATTTPPFSWLDNRVHFWKGGKWAIQLRVPIAAANQPISAGIEKGSSFWYEATMVTTVPYASIAKWPLASTAKTGVTTSICPQQSTPDFLVHEELGSIDATNCPLCAPDKFSKLTTDPAGTPPTDCDSGLSIDSPRIGAVFNSTGPFDTVGLTNDFKVVGSIAKNTVVAQIRNEDSTAAFSGKVQARFRLANWGSTAFNMGSTDTGTWDDIPGGAAVCLGGGTTCTVQTIPQMQTPNPLNSQKAIFFDWTLGTGPSGASEFCGYGLTPPGGSCTTTGCPTDQVKATGSATCVKIKNSHQCMFVELSSPNSEASFVKASAFNNMNFGQMSVFAREALVDARGLPAAPGQPYQDIYLFAIPRNMPATVPPTTTVQQLVQQNAFALATEIAKPYRDDIARLQASDPAKLAEILRGLEQQRKQLPDTPSREPHHASDQEVAIRSAMRGMPNDEFERVHNILDIAVEQGTAEQLVHDAVTTLGPADAAQVVPTLEVYPYFQPLGVGHAYQPMTSFTVFLSHEAQLAGMHYEIDGAVRVAENVYHMRIPTGYAKRIQVRAATIDPTQSTIPPGDPHWPCTPSGGCSCGSKTCGLVGTANMLPGLLALAFVLRRRRQTNSAITPGCMKWWMR